MNSGTTELVLLLLSVLTAVGALPNHGTPAASLEEMQTAKAHSKMMMHKMCCNKSGTTEEHLMALRNADFDNVDDKSKCFLHCMLQAMGMVTADDMLNFEAMHLAAAKLTPSSVADKAMETLDHCNNAAGEDACDAAFQFAKCTQMMNKEYYEAFF